MSEWLSSVEDQRVIGSRLRAQAPSARVEPARDLEWRVIGALDTARPLAPPSPRRAMPAYLSAAALLLLVGAVAIVACPTAPLAPTSPTFTAARVSTSAPRDMEIVIGIDTTRYAAFVETRAGHLATAFESPLFDQARRMMTDARHAVGVVLARVPAPVRIEAGRAEMRSPEGLRIRESG